MKKQVKSIVKLGIALVLLAVAYLFVIKGGQEDGKHEGTQIEESTIVALESVKIENANGTGYSLLRNRDGSYAIAGYDEEYAINESAVADAFDAFCALKDEEELQDVDESLDLGFEESNRRITGRWSDGSEETFIIGKATPFSDGFYVEDTLRKKTLVAGNEICNSFMKDVLDFRLGVIFPAWEEPSREILRVKMTSGEEVIFDAFLRDEEEQSEIDGIASSRYALTEPVDASTSRYEMEKQVLYPLAALNTGEVLCDGELPLELYGLSEPRYTIEVESERGNYCLNIGNEENGHVYVMREDIPSILSVSIDSIKTVLETNYLDIVNSYFWVHSSKDVAYVTIKNGDESHVLQFN